MRGIQYNIQSFHPRTFRKRVSVWVRLSKKLVIIHLSLRFINTDSSSVGPSPRGEFGWRSRTDVGMFHLCSSDSGSPRFPTSFTYVLRKWLYLVTLMVLFEMEEKEIDTGEWGRSDKVVVTWRLVHPYITEKVWRREEEKVNRSRLNRKKVSTGTTVVRPNSFDRGTCILVHYNFNDITKH